MTIRAAILTYIALLALLAITVASTFVPLGMGNSVINLTIAAIKAALIAWVYMHLRLAEPLVRLVIGTLVLWLCFLFGLSLLDLMTR